MRGTGYFWGIELVKDQATKETWAGDDAERLLRGFVSPEMFRRGLICRSDDRGDPVVQLAPPLISTRDDIDFMVGIAARGLHRSVQAQHLVRRPPLAVVVDARRNPSRRVRR